MILCLAVLCIAYIVYWRSKQNKDMYDGGSVMRTVETSHEVAV